MPKPLIGLLLFVLSFGVCDPWKSYGLDKQISLTEAVKAALKENHEIRATENIVLSRQADVGLARSAFLPRIAFEERAVRTNNPPTVFMMKLNQGRFSQSDFDLNTLNNPQPATDLQSLFSIEQTVFDLRSFMGLTMAKREHAAQSENYQRKKEELALKVVQVYLQVHTAKGYVEVARKTLEDAQEHLRVVEVRHKNGLGLYSDILRAQTALISAQQQKLSAEKNWAVAKRMLGLLLGSYDSFDCDDQNIRLPINSLEYYLSASQGRRDLRALKIHHENARNKVKLAESRYFPTLHLGGSYQFNDHNSPFGTEGESWLISAVLRWDLFDGTNREYERIKAHYLVKETEERIKDLAQWVSFKINEAYLTVEESRKNAELAGAALKTAEESQRLVKSRYENSLSPLVDFLDVQLQLNQSRANQVAKENEYLFAIVNLGFEGGTILKDLNID